MLLKLALTGFRGFSRLDLDLAQVTAILGRNSSGKTSVLHAIRLVCDVVGSLVDDASTSPQAAAERGVIALCTDTVVPDPARFLALSDWREVFTNAEVGEGVSLQLELTFQPSDLVQYASLKLAYGRNAQLKMSVTLRSERAWDAVSGLPRKSKHRPQRLREELQRLCPLCVLVPAFYGVTSSEEYRTQPVVNRLLGGGAQSHIVRNLLARMDGASVERMNVFLRRAVGATLTARTPRADAEQRGHLVAKYRDTNGELELSSAGAGLIGMIALYAAMDGIRGVRDGRSVIFLLDEPEAHLHPRLQADVGEELAKLAVEFGNQLVFATHSVEMINRVGLDPAALLVAVDRTAGVAISLRNQDELIRQLDEFCDLTPFASLSFLSSRRVLFHEGPTDHQVLDACARVYFRSDDERLAQWRRYVLIPLDGAGNVSVRGVLERVLSPKLFLHLDATRAVRAALVLDRDYERAPKDATLQKVKPHLQTVDVVWSRHSLESLFLDPACLQEWLAPSLPAVSAAELRAVLQRAIEEVDRDPELLERAEDERVRVHRRPDSEKKAFTEAEARKRARKEVREQPGIWQQGKARAKMILARVRTGLGGRAHALRGSLVDLVHQTPPGQISDPKLAVPEEVRKLLDECVRP